MSANPEDLMDELLGDTAPTDAEAAAPISDLPDVDDLLGGGGTPWAKLKEAGQTITGTVTEVDREHRTSFEKNEALYWPRKGQGNRPVPLHDPAADRGRPVADVVFMMQCEPGFDAEARELEGSPIEDDDGVRKLVFNSKGKSAVLVKALEEAKIAKVSQSVGRTFTMTCKRKYNATAAKAALKDAIYEASFAAE